MTVLDVLAEATAGAREQLQCKIRAAADALETVRAEALLSRPLSLRRAQLKLVAVDEAYRILIAAECAEAAATREARTP